MIRRLAEILPALRRSQRGTVLTSFLLFDLDDLALTKQCLDLLREGLAEIDEDLVLNLYSAGDRKIKLALASSVVSGRMKPRAFRKIFDVMYARSDLSLQERRELMWNLERFLIRNPSQSPAYERSILQLARSPNLSLSIRGIPMTARFARLDPATLELLVSKLKSRSVDLRGTALEGFYHLIERIDTVAPCVRDVIASDAFREQVARIQKLDPDDSVRRGARAVLRRLRRALGPRNRRV